LPKALTIFGCLKPFQGAADLAQRNAIKSWTRLSPRPDILLYGGDRDTAAICEDLGARYVPDAVRNRWGTVVLNGLFESAQRLARTDVMCYANADMILMSDFAQAVETVSHECRRFLLIGQRWDTDVTEPIPFDRADWEQSLRTHALACGRVHPTWGIDYFVFTRGLLDPVPPFAVGRPAFDNWFIYRARSRWAPVVDATPTVLAIHQNHDYSFHPDGWQGIRESEEAMLNVTLAGGHDHMFLIDDRTHVLSADGLKLDGRFERLKQHWRRLPVLVPSSLRSPVQALQMGVRAIRARRPKSTSAPYPGGTPGSSAQDPKS
jgi:hypothetical protein